MDWLQILSNSASSILSPATMAYALAALGLAVHFGFAGLINMGIAGFVALGAYGYAISILTFATATYRVIETPIVFRDRRFGSSKMSWRIVAESMWLVTIWGVRDLHRPRSAAAPANIEHRSRDQR